MQITISVSYDQTGMNLFDSFLGYGTSERIGLS